MDDGTFNDAVIDYGWGEATPQQAPLIPRYRSNGDYARPDVGEGEGNGWQQYSDPWYGTADVQLVNGQATIPIELFYDGVPDGHATITWAIKENMPFGFTQETYVLNEAAENVNSDIDKTTISVSDKYDIKTATVIVLDAQSVFSRIDGDDKHNNLQGSDGNDLILARGGNDKVKGKHGDDYLYGEGGKDTLEGGWGKDYLNGGSGKDTLKGEAGDDILDGSTGDDTLQGRDGNDKLLGYFGHDELVGGDGDDILSGGPGNDKLNSGAGGDTFVFYSLSHGVDKIKDFEVGTDKIQISSKGFGRDLISDNDGFVLKANQFTIGSAAVDVNTRFIYNFGTGDLFFDSDGTGNLAKVKIASLSAGLALSSTDIFVNNLLPSTPSPLV